MSYQEPVVVDGVVQATFFKFDAVHSKGVYRLTFEIPAHGANEAVQALGGLPDPGAVKTVAIALLSLVPNPPRAPVEEPKQIEAPRREYPLSSRVAMTCQEQSFKEFLRQRFHDQFNGDPAEFVRWYCDVGSRAEIKPGTDAEGLWNKLHVQYENYQRGW
jgi:hypothetical protein